MSVAPSRKVTNHTHINNCLGWVLHLAEKLQTIHILTTVWDECCTKQKSYQPYTYQQLFGVSLAPSRKVTNHTHINNCLGWVLHLAEKLQTIYILTTVWGESCTSQKSYKPYTYQQLFGMSHAPSRKVTNHTHINNCLGWVLHPAEKLQTIPTLTTVWDECWT